MIDTATVYSALCGGGNHGLMEYPFQSYWIPCGVDPSVCNSGGDDDRASSEVCICMFRYRNLICLEG